jgi:cell division protein FtsW
MARKLQSDKWLFLATVALLCASVVMVYSASALIALERFQQPYLFVTKQVMWALLGTAILYLVMRVDYRTYRQEQAIWAALGVAGFMLVAVLFSREINGTRRWFGVGGLGIQPSEVAKMIAVVFCAVMLERRMHRINDIKYSLVPLGLVVGAMVGLILLEPDFGTAMAIVTVTGIMVIAAGLNWSYLAAALAILLPTAWVLIMSSPYRAARIFTFLNPEADPLGNGFQILQSLIAVGTGGVTGKGLMGGVQKLFYLPEPHTDFIYAVISEELGLVGASLILACFAIIVWRGLRTAANAPDAFGSLLALGLTMMIAVQAFVNMSVVLGLLPTKGIPLPLVSSGGSSLLINLVGVGILLNISQHATADSGPVGQVEPGAA